jgi:hypothetical protein
LFGFDEGISTSQQATISAQQREIRGREISPGQAKSVMAALKGQKTPPFTVLVTISDVEAGRFAISIWELLRKSGVKADVKFLDKDPSDDLIYLSVGTTAREDDTVESDRVVKALWDAGVIDRFWPIRPFNPLGPSGPKEQEIPGAYGPQYVLPNSVFVGKRVPPQDIWQEQIK